ncbi:hypothetical protein ACUH96_00880 [Dermabacteraceae bacterium P13077]
MTLQSMRTRPDGKWAAFESALVANRQNGKSFWTEVRMLAGLFLFGERRILFSAHHHKTAVETFTHLARIVESSPALMREVRSMPTGYGNEAIVLRNGAKLKFMARQRGGGRGFTGDTIILDEAAFGLDAQVVASLLPTMAARSITGNPQLIYSSSAGVASSTVLEGVRKRGIEGKDARLSYMEMSARPWDDYLPSERVKWASRDEWRADPAVWAEANPAFGRRISLDYLQSEHDAFMGISAEEEFERERLGVWSRVGSDSALPVESWRACADPSAEAGDVVVFAVDVPPSRDSATIAMASPLPDGRVLVEVVDVREGTSWVPERLRQLQQKWSPRAVVVAPGSAAGTLLPEIKREGVHPLEIPYRQYAQSCGVVYDLVRQRQLAHLDDDVLAEAVEASRVKLKGDSLWVWDRKNAVSNVSPLVAVTLAVWGVRKRGSSPRERKVVCL